MRKKDALAYFGNNGAALGRAINVSRVTVHEWPPVIPLEPARALEIVTQGELKINESLYPRLKLAKRLLLLRQRAAA
jgi:hypothetical protein